MQIPMSWHMYSVLWKTSGFTKWKCKWLTSLVIKGLQEPNVPAIFQRLLINRAHSQTGAQLVQRATFSFSFYLQYDFSNVALKNQSMSRLPAGTAVHSTGQYWLLPILPCIAVSSVCGLQPIEDSQVAPTEPPFSRPKHKHWSLVDHLNLSVLAWTANSPLASSRTTHSLVVSMQLAAHIISLHTSFLLLQMFKEEK